MCYPVLLRDADWARVAIAPGWRPDNNKYDIINNYLFPFPIYFVILCVHWWVACQMMLPTFTGSQVKPPCDICRTCKKNVVH